MLGEKTKKLPWKCLGNLLSLLIWKVSPQSQQHQTNTRSHILTQCISIVSFLLHSTPDTHYDFNSPKYLWFLKCLVLILPSLCTCCSIWLKHSVYMHVCTHTQTHTCQANFYLLFKTQLTPSPPLYSPLHSTSSRNTEVTSLSTLLYHIFIMCFLH